MNTAILALEDGTVFEGLAFGAPKDSGGEVVFNTSITGYQEIFTDPSYSGQIVVLTNPQIGNYGANSYDREAGKPHIEGVIVREISSIASNWQSDEKADAFLAEHGIAVASGIDTRALVRHLRTRGVMRGILSVTGGDRASLIERVQRLSPGELVGHRGECVTAVQGPQPPRIVASSRSCVGYHWCSSSPPFPRAPRIVQRW